MSTYHSKICFLCNSEENKLNLSKAKFITYLGVCGFVLFCFVIETFLKAMKIKSIENVNG